MCINPVVWALLVCTLTAVIADSTEMTWAEYKKKFHKVYHHGMGGDNEEAKRYY